MQRAPDGGPVAPDGIRGMRRAHGCESCPGLQRPVRYARMFTGPFQETAQRAVPRLFITAIYLCGSLQGQERVAPELDRIFSDSRFQVDADFVRERPGPAPRPLLSGEERNPLRSDPSRVRSPREGRVRPPRAESAGSGGWNFDAGNLVGWIALGILLVLMVAAFVRLRAEARIPVTRRSKKVEGGEPAASPAPAAGWPGELDRAISRGDWDAALRILLRAMFDRFPEQVGRAPRPWETGRRIAGWTDLGPALKQAVARLVAAVEASRFRGVPACEEEFRLCFAACEAMLDRNADSP